MLGGRRVSDGPWKRGLQNLLDSSPNRKGIRNNRKRGHSVQFPVSFLVHLEGSSAAGEPEPSREEPVSRPPSWTHSALWCLEARACVPVLLLRPPAHVRDVGSSLPAGLVLAFFPGVWKIGGQREPRCGSNVGSGDGQKAHLGELGGCGLDPRSAVAG